MVMPSARSLLAGGDHEIDAVEIEKGVARQFLLVETHGVVKTAVVQLLDRNAQRQAIACHRSRQNGEFARVQRWTG